jgi:hypothetical protein
MSTGVAYRHKLRWNGDSNLAPIHTGYDQHIALRTGREGTYGQANGTLNNNTNTWPLFVTAVDIDFEVSGSTAQSRLTRDFYPHNFVQPVFQISGQSIDNVDYAQMCEFIRESQYDLVSNFQLNKLMQIYIKQRGIPGGRTTGPVVSFGGKTETNQIMRGSHKPILAQGVILSIPRQHQTGVWAPEWTFGFQVYSMMEGPFVEGPTISDTGDAKTWVDLLNSGTNISSTSAMITANSKILAATMTNSASILNATAGHGNYTPGSTGSGTTGGGGGQTGPGGGGSVNSNLLNSSQNTFASALSEASGLAPNVVAAWTLAEEPKSSSEAPNGANNWLNIGDTGSGNFGGSAACWNDPTTAGSATSQWLKGPDYKIGGYGPSSSGIQAIFTTVGQGASTQIKAIQNSGWASSGYPLLEEVYQEILAG